VSKFKVGDRVRSTSNYMHPSLLIGSVGVVTEVRPPYRDYLYEVDFRPNGRLPMREDEVEAYVPNLPELVKAITESNHTHTQSKTVDTPDHYTSHPSGIETIDITKHESFLRGNILKYILRAPYKGFEVEDLKKAQKYLAWEIERLENER
jgi:hypothetical protein